MNRLSLFAVCCVFLANFFANNFPVSCQAQNPRDRDSDRDGNRDRDRDRNRDRDDPFRRPVPGLILPPPTQPPAPVPIIPSLLNLAAGLVAGHITKPRPPPQSDPFTCFQRYPGYYADKDRDCRNFFICTPDGGRHYFECGYERVFNQYELVCDRRSNYDCRQANRDYVVNRYRRPFLDTQYSI